MDGVQFRRPYWITCEGRFGFHSTREDLREGVGFSTLIAHSDEKDVGR